MAKPLVLWQSHHHLIMPRDYLKFSRKNTFDGILLSIEKSNEMFQTNFSIIRNRIYQRVMMTESTWTGPRIRKVGKQRIQLHLLTLEVKNSLLDWGIFNCICCILTQEVDNCSKQVSSIIHNNSLDEKCLILRTSAATDLRG